VYLSEKNVKKVILKFLKIENIYYALGYLDVWGGQDLKVYFHNPTVGWFCRTTQSTKIRVNPMFVLCAERHLVPYDTIFTNVCRIV
jgi:hypothetical protein